MVCSEVFSSVLWVMFYDAKKPANAFINFGIGLHSAMHILIVYEVRIVWLVLSYFKIEHRQI